MGRTSTSTPTLLLLGTALVILICSISSSADAATAQKLCELINSRNLSRLASPAASIFINHFSSNKCLRVGNAGPIPVPGAKVLIDECSWWKNVSLNQIYEVKRPTGKTTTDGYNLKIASSIQPAAGTRDRMESQCLSVSKDGKLVTENCAGSSTDQVWKFKPIVQASNDSQVSGSRASIGNDNQFLLQQLSSSKCLTSTSLAASSEVKLVPCNAYQTEQLWKLCLFNKQ